jgi:hypothetical protein
MPAIVPPTPSRLVRVVANVNSESLQMGLSTASWGMPNIAYAKVSQTVCRRRSADSSASFYGSKIYHLFTTEGEEEMRIADESWLLVTDSSNSGPGRRSLRSCLAEPATLRTHVGRMGWLLHTASVPGGLGKRASSDLHCSQLDHPRCHASLGSLAGLGYIAIVHIRL